MLAVGNVARNENSTTASRFHQVSGLLRVVVLVEVGNQDVGAFTGKCDNHCTANAAVATRDHRNLPEKTIRASVAFFAVVRLWMHRCCKARRPVLLLGRNVRYVAGWHAGLSQLSGPRSGPPIGAQAMCLL